MGTEKRPPGRRPRHDYGDPMLLLEVEGWARDGLDDRQVAGRLGIRADHLCTVKNRHPALAEALRRGRRPLEVLVENALFRRALGMRVRTTVRDVAPDGTELSRRETEAELPPDVGAAMAWLKHRKPAAWSQAAQLRATGREQGEGSGIPIEKWLLLTEG